MKIVLLYDKLDVGGTEKLMILIASLLSRHGHQVTMLLTQAPAKLDHLIGKDIETIYLHRRHKFAPGPMKQLAAVCNRADVVHVHTYFNYRYYYLAKVLFSISRPRVVLHEHSNMLSVKWFDRLLFKAIDAFIAVSKKQVQKLQQWKCIADEKIFHISNIMSVPQKVKEKASPARRIMMVGNIRREKNYELAIGIVKNTENLELDIFGNINDEKYFTELQEKVGDKLSPRVKFIHGESDVSLFFNNYDLALHTAKFETGPLVLMEYLSAGLPFFSSVAGQAQAVISQYFPDVVVDSYETNQWVEKVNGFYDKTQQERNEMAKALQEKAGVIINEEAYYNNIMEVYKYTGVAS